MARTDKKTFRDRRAEIEPHWRPGMSRQQLAEALGLSRNRLWQIYTDFPRLGKLFPLAAKPAWHDRDMTALSPEAQELFAEAAARGLTMAEMSAASGVTVAMISQWASGAVVPRASSIQKVRSAIENIC